MSIKLTQPQAERLRRLLHMEYTVTELAEEIGCSRRIIDRAIAEGCPHHKNTNRLYVVGDTFAGWYRTQAQREQTKITLAPNEGYCLHCRKATPLIEEHSEPNSKGVVLVRGRCGICGKKVSRFRKEAA